MATWTNIADTVLEPGKPIRAIDARALRDNPIAIAEGASGAPKIEDAALDGTVTTDGTDWVLDRTAAASTGAVGTYALLRRTANAAPSDTVAGSDLVYAGGINTAAANGGATFVDGTGNVPAAIRSFSLAAGASTSPSGTWRCMGRIEATASSTGAGTTVAPTSSATAATLWLRIS